MSDSQQATRRVHPTTLVHARELRHEMTPQENKLWQRLRQKQLYGLKFRHQHPIHHYILDFFCHEHKLAVEVDGHSHAEPAQQARDLARKEWLAQRGIQVIRFANREIDTNIEAVLDEIARACGVQDPPSNSPHRGEDHTFPPVGEIEGGQKP